MGSKIHLIERDSTMLHRAASQEDNASPSYDFELLIEEGKHGFRLLERAIIMLALSGFALCLAGIALMIVSTRRPIQTITANDLHVD